VPLDDLSLQLVNSDVQELLDEAIMDRLADRGYLLEEVILTMRGYARSGGAFQVVRANVPQDKLTTWDAPGLLMWAAQVVAEDQGLVSRDDDN
jgi:hypothetical protein